MREYRVYTKSVENAFERIKANHPPLQNNSVQILSQNYDGFRKLYLEYRKVERPRKISKIMVVGYPMNYYRGPFSSFALNKLFLEYKAIVCLRDFGYRVIYKMHPDRIHARLFEGFGIEVIRETRFEDVIQVPDAFLFLHTGTSTFTISLLTNKPVVFLDHPGAPWFQDQYCLLKKRCGVVNGYYDNNNRLSFQEQELLDVLNVQVREPDSEFAETYMFP